MKQYSLSGAIGEEIGVQNISEILNEANGDDIELKFTSVGGYVSDGLEMYNLVRDYSGKTKIILNGTVASIASYISMAFDEIIARDNTAFMIHNAWGAVIGNHRDVESYAKYLKTLTNIIADAYVARSGKSKNEVLQLMDKETWMYGKEILDNGFANSIVTTGLTEKRETVISKASIIFNSFKLPMRRDDMEKAVAMVIEASNGIMSKSVSNARRLIRSGDFDDSSPWSFSGADGNKLLGDNGDDWTNYALWHMYENTDASPETKARYGYPYGKNDKVYRSALRAIASRAAQQGLDDLSNTASDLLGLMDEQRRSSSKKRGNKVEKAELLEAAATARVNNDLTLSEIAKAMHLEDQVITEAHKNALNVMGEFSKLGVTDPVSAFKAMNEMIKKTEKDRIENRIKAEFDPDGLGEKNILFTYAKNQLGGKTEAELDEAIENFKADPVAKKLAGELANVFSASNQIGVTETRGNGSNAIATAPSLTL